MGKKNNDSANQTRSFDNTNQPTHNDQPNAARLDTSPTQTSSKEEQWRAEQRQFANRQICAAWWLNGITLGAAGVALFGLVILYWSLGDTHIAATAANVSAKTAQRQLQLSERPWVVPTISVQPTTLNKMTPIGAAIHLTNIGKTPAKDILTEVAIEVVNRTSPPKLSYPLPDVKSFVGILFPTDATDFKAGVGGPPNLLDPTDYDNLKRGDSYIVAYLRIHYVDTLGTDHWLTECVWHAWVMNQTFSSAACVAYANTDNN